MSNLDTPTPGDEITSKILAYVGSAAIGFVAVINTVIAAMAIFTGNLIGAIGDVNEKANGGEALTSSAHHAALNAKLVAVGFGLLAGLCFVAGAFIKYRKRHVFVPIATGITVAGWVGFSVWTAHFSSLDAIIIGCALFATFIWYRQPKTLPSQPAYSSGW
jgi:hypothetical protein